MANKRFGQCSGKFQVSHDRNPKFRRLSSNEILVFQYPMRGRVSFVAGNVDHYTNLSVLEVIHYVRFLLLTHFVEYPTFDPVLREFFRGMLCCEYPVACSRQHSSIRKYSLSSFTHRDENGVVLLWNVEVAGDQGVDECLLERFTETSHLSRRNHFDPCHRVRLVQPCEGELRSFHSDSSMNSLTLLYGPASYGLRGQI